MSGGRAEDDLVQRLEEASPPGLEAAFEDILEKATSDSWLPSNNQYKTHTIKNLKRDKENLRIPMKMTTRSD